MQNYYFQRSPIYICSVVNNAHSNRACSSVYWIAASEFLCPGGMTSDNDKEHDSDFVQRKILYTGLQGSVDFACQLAKVLTM